MRSQRAVKGPTKFKTPAELREEATTRDRSLALTFVGRGEPRGGAAAIAKETGFSRRLVYRAVKAHLDWARETLKVAGTPGQASPAGSERITDPGHKGTCSAPSKAADNPGGSE